MASIFLYLISKPVYNDQIVVHVVGFVYLHFALTGRIYTRSVSEDPYNLPARGSIIPTGLERGITPINQSLAMCFNICFCLTLGCRDYA